MALTSTQQALLLFKKLMYKGSANPAFDFFEEPKNARQAVLADQVWQQSADIPSTAPGASVGVVDKFSDLVLTALAGTSNRAYYHASLIDAIPFNFGDGTSYNYTVKDSLGTVIPFGTGDWVVDPDAGTLTFYGTVPANMPPTISFWRYTGTKGVGSGVGGGGGSTTTPAGPIGLLAWTLDSNAPVESTSGGVDLLAFEYLSSQEIWTTLVVPPNYTAGTQVNLVGALFATTATSGKVKFKATTYLMRPGTTVLGTFTDTHTSANAEVTVSGTPSQITQVGAIDLTDASGQVNATALQAGDVLIVKLIRDSAGESASAAADANLFRSSLEGDFGLAAGGGSSGDGGSFVWRLYSNAPTPAVPSGADVLDFDYLSSQEIWGQVVVPDAYTAGSQILLSGGAFAITATSGKVKFKATTTLIRPGTTVLGTYPNTYVSTNAEVTAAAVASRATSVGSIDLTNASGEINAVPVQAGDILFIKLIRDTAGESASAAADARLFQRSMTVDFALGATTTSGGVGLLDWTQDSNAPVEGDSAGVELYDFDYLSEQELWVHVTVPPNYVAGSQVSLVGGAFATTASSGKVLFRATTYLARQASTVLGTYANTYTSTNAEVTVSGTPSQVTAIGDIDLTNAAGEINSVPLQAGDLLLIKLVRKTSSESSPAAADARLFRTSLAADFGLTFEGTGTDPISVDNTSVEFFAGVLRVKPLGITTAKLASGAVTGPKINASAVDGATLEHTGAVLRVKAAGIQSTHLAAGVGTPPGAILMWTTENAPTGWLMCNGALVSRTTYAALFAAVSTQFGAGDGSTTFNLPDLRGAFVRGGMNGATGEVGGSGTASSNQATFTGHGFKRTGLRVRMTSGALTGLSAGTDYYIIYVDANTLSFATTLSNAFTGTKVTISGANSAGITQWEDPDTGSRLGPSGGGSTIGGIQEDDFKSHNHGGGAHTHSYTAPGSAGGAGGGVPTGTTVGGTTGSSGTIITTQGGNDTRPRNVMLNYIIKT
jgi:microcystin-dependent protein